MSLEATHNFQVCEHIVENLCGFLEKPKQQGAQSIPPCNILFFITIIKIKAFLSNKGLQSVIIVTSPKQAHEKKS